VLLCGVTNSRFDRWRWLAVLATVAMLTACVSTVGGQASSAGGRASEVREVFEQVQAPAVGSCLDTVRGGAGMLGAPPSLNCSEPHGGEVARVVEIPEALADSYPTNEELSSDAWGDLLTSDEGCLDYLLPSDYLGAREQDNLLVSSAAYLPKRVAWEAGARWMACVVEFRIGLVEDANAPGRMADAMLGPDASAYRECWFGPETVYDIVPCSLAHEAEPTGDIVDAEPGSPYPTDPLSRQPYVDECADRVVDYLERDVPNGYAVGVYMPLPEDWAVYPEVKCVILDSADRRTSGSATDA